MWLGNCGFYYSSFYLYYFECFNRTPMQRWSQKNRWCFTNQSFFGKLKKDWDKEAETKIVSIRIYSASIDKVFFLPKMRKWIQYLLIRFVTVYKQQYQNLKRNYQLQYRHSVTCCTSTFLDKYFSGTKFSSPPNFFFTYVQRKRLSKSKIC